MEEIKTPKIRVPIYDYARVFVAYLVILGHCLPSDDHRLRPYIYAFHMPFFFLISGMLYKEEITIPWRKLFRSLIFPFVFFNLICFLFIPLMIELGIIEKFSNYPNDTHLGMFNLYIEFFKQTIRNTILGGTFPNIPIWFLLALFWCKLSMSILNRYRIIIPLFILFMIIVIHFHVFQLMIGNSMMAFPFFLAGYKNKLRPIEWTPVKWSYLIGLLMIVISVLLTNLNGNTSMWRINFGIIAYPFNILVYYFNAFLASYGVLYMFSRLKVNSKITSYANGLISILCLQMIFYYPFQIRRYGENLILCFMVSIAIFFICVKLHYLIEKYIPAVIGKIRSK